MSDNVRDVIVFLSLITAGTVIAAAGHPFGYAMLMLTMMMAMPVVIR